MNPGGGILAAHALVALGLRRLLAPRRPRFDRIVTAGRLSSMRVFHRYFIESGAELRANGIDACINDGGRRS
jgi:hypothetical protein